MRAVIVALAALAPLAGGCGGGQFASPVGHEEDASTATTVTTAPAVGPQHRLVVAAEVAAAVNVRPSDFPYLSEQDQSGNSGAGESSHEFAKCFDRVPQPERDLATSSSPQLGGPLGGEAMFFSSTVEVFPRPAGATDVIDALRDRRVFACFARQVRPAIEREQAGGEVEILRVRVTRLDLPTPGIEKSFSLRITATVAPAPENRQLTAYTVGTTPDGRPRANIYVDLVFFASDRIAVLMLAGGGPSPVPASIERNTLRLLRERAEREAGRLR
jgi:hypothetical protein